MGVAQTTPAPSAAPAATVPAPPPAATKPAPQVAKPQARRLLDPVAPPAPAKPKPGAPLIAEPPAPSAPPANDKLPVRERERRVYVPYEDLEKVFKDGGKGVFLPYREFLDLWNELTLKRDEEDKPPPAEAVVSRAEYTGKVEGESLVLDAVITVQSFKKGWVLVPLVDKAVPGIGEADTGKAVLRSRADGADVMLPEKGVYELKLKIYAPVVREEGRQVVRLHLPKAAVSRMKVTIPGENLEFQLTPAVAYTTQPGGVAAPGTTEFSCFLGSAAEEQQIAWAQTQAATQMTPIVLAETKLDVHVGTGSVATQADVQFRILRAPVDSLNIGLPAEQEVLGVSGPGLREWNVEAGAGGGKKLVIKTDKPVRDDVNVKLSLEAPLARLPAEVAAPAIEILGAAYARGTVQVTTEPQLDVSARTMTEVTRAQTAAAAAQGRVAVGGFRVLKQPWQLSFDVAEARAQVDVSSVMRVEIERDKATFRSRLSYDVRRVGIFEARVGLPAGWTIGTVTGDGIGEWNVDTTQAASPVLVVKLPQQKTGTFSFLVSGRKVRAAPEEDAVLPVLAPQNVVRHEAKVGVSVHSSLEANTKDLGDFQQDDVVRYGPKPILSPAQSEGDVTLDGATLAFRYRDAAKPATLSFKGRSSQVTVEVLTLVNALEQSTRHTWTLAFDVAYAATDRFVLAVPKAIAADVRFVDEAVKEIHKDYKPAKAPADLPDAANYVLWEVVLRSEQLGTFRLTLSHEKPAAVEAGKTGRIELLQVHVPGAFQETGQVAVVKDDSLEIRDSKPEGLEEIDSRELEGALQSDRVFLAYKYRALPVKLSVEVAKNSYFSVPQAMVTYADLTTAVATDRAQTTEVIYWVKNNDLQFLVVRLPKGARLVSDIVVDRQAQQPLRREGSDDLLIRLPSATANLRMTFPVRFVFEVPSPKAGEKLGWMGALTVNAPVVDQVGVMETRHVLYLPEAWHYTAFNGPLTQEMKERGWGRARRLVDPLIPAFGPQLDTLNRPEWSDPPRLASETSNLFDFQVPKQGLRETLRRVGAPADMDVSFRSRKITFALEAVAFLLTFLAGISCWKCPLSKKVLFAAIFGLGGMLMTGLLSPANSLVAIAVMLAAGAVVLLWLALGCFGFCGALLRRIKEGKPKSPVKTSPSAASTTSKRPPMTAPTPHAPAPKTASGPAQPAAAKAPPPAPAAPTPPAPPPAAQPPGSVDILELPELTEEKSADGDDAGEPDSAK